MKQAWVAILLASCAIEQPDVEAVARRLPITVSIDVRADGTFSRPDVEIYSGDTVRWTFADRRQAIIPVRGPAPPIGPVLFTPGSPMPYVEDTTNLHAFAGPMPIAPGGIFVLNPNPGDRGLAQRPSCANPRATVGAVSVCEQGTVDAIMDATYADPAITGVYLRFNWSQVNPSRDVYDWTVLDREVDKAVANGKLYSVSVEAGGQGTPAWIFQPTVLIPGSPPPPIATRYRFEEPLENGNCREVVIGAPTDADYEALYIGMLEAMATHLKQRADRYRALAYIKPSGANLFTGENRLPNECDGTCECANEEWARAGYTPFGLLQFYAEQLSRISRAFPDKVMSYALIQAGFPLVESANKYAYSTSPVAWTCLPSGPGPLLDCSAPFSATQQTEDVMSHGLIHYNDRFAVQHNGLGPDPATVPASPDYHEPNQWVVTSSAAYTGFQTQNGSSVSTNVLLNSTLVNGFDNSDANFIEIYEERAWEARTRGGAINPTGPVQAQRTLADWDQRYRTRRGADAVVYEHTFTTSTPLTLYYKEARAIGAAHQGILRVRTWP